MKKQAILISVTVLLLILASGILFFHSNYVVLGGNVYSKSISALDLSGKPVPAPEQFLRFDALSVLDLRDTGITPDQYAQLCAALPNCEILWSVPFQGHFYPQDTAMLQISSLTDADLAVLSYFPCLTQIDATGCRDYEKLMRLQSRYPLCEITYQVEVGGILWDRNTTALTAEITSAQELADALAYLPALQSAQISGCSEYAQLQALQAQYPDCQIRYSVSVEGRLLPHDTAELTLQGGDFQKLMEILPFLPSLTQVTFAGTQPEPSTIDAAMALRPDVTYIWEFDILGVKVSSQDTAIDLSDIPMESCAPVEKMLKYFNRLETVDMCGCGISNEEMAALNQRHPQTLFVWEVKIGRILLRTDATYFMPEKYHMAVDDGDCVNLKYCTQLICLDLGHQNVSDGSFMNGMTKMQYLLIGDTGITDLSFCANMPELLYLEMFMTRVKDLTPLLQCTKLEDLNIGYTPKADPAPLYQMTHLKNLWASGPYIDHDEEAALKNALPDTRLYFKSGSSTAGGWRQLPNYYKMRDILGMYYIKE